MHKPDPLLDYMWRAINSRFGLWFRTNNPERLRQRFYALRRQFPGNFECLSILRTRDGRIWLLNREGKEKSDEEERDA